MPSATDTSSFLDNLYRAKFNREPDAAGKAYWSGQLAAGKISRDNVSTVSYTHLTLPTNREV